jgi:HSP20 family protein
MRLFLNRPESLFSDFDRLFGQTTWPALREDTYFKAPVDVEETATHYVMNVDVPGFRKEDIKIEARDSLLHISGERKVAADSDAERKYHLRERAVGRFERSFRLGHGVDWNGIEARFENGVLSVTVPKAESAKPRAIEIR